LPSVATLIGVFLVGVVAGFYLLAVVCAMSDRDPGCERGQGGGRPPNRVF
jgi:hypothetical protein